MVKATQRKCLYCGKAARRVQRGEHVVPEALGGAVTISELCRDRVVCHSCNNGVLSDLDRELCSRSPLSIVAAQELDAFLWQAWDVDHSARNLLLEARPDFEKESMVVHPQMVFDEDGPQLRGDFEDINRVGRDGYQHIFVRHMREAFEAFRSGETHRLNRKNLGHDHLLLDRYRYPPRIVARRPILDFRRGMSFDLQYLVSSDCRSVLAALDRWDSAKKFRGWDVGLGSALPAVAFSYDCGKVLRAMYKIGLNLVAALCQLTPVDRESFDRVVQVVTGEIPVPPELMALNGFVRGGDFKAIAKPDAHSFRVFHTRGYWYVHASYFGGRVGSRVRFLGPCRELWTQANVVAPLRSKAWEIERTATLPVVTEHRVEWTDTAAIVPSLEMFNVESNLRIEAIAK